MSQQKSKLMRVSMELADLTDKIVQNHGRMISKIAATKIIAKKAGGKNSKPKKIEWNDYL